MIHNVNLMITDFLFMFISIMPFILSGIVTIIMGSRNIRASFLSEKRKGSCIIRFIWGGILIICGFLCIVLLFLPAVSSFRN